jgi:hypothetical protein
MCMLCLSGYKGWLADNLNGFTRLTWKQDVIVLEVQHCPPAHVFGLCKNSATPAYIQDHILQTFER